MALLIYQMHPMAFHAPEVVEEPARKTQEPRTPLSHFPQHSLTSISSGLGSRTLGTQLANISLGLALGSLSSGLGLVGLLGSGGGLLLVLAVLDGLGSGGGAGLRSHGAALLDHIEGSTNDSSLGLDGSAGSLLGNLL